MNIGQLNFYPKIILVISLTALPFIQAALLSDVCGNFIFCYLPYCTCWVLAIQFDLPLCCIKVTIVYALPKFRFYNKKG